MRKALAYVAPALSPRDEFIVVDLDLCSFAVLVNDLLLENGRKLEFTRFCTWSHRRKQIAASDLRRRGS